MSDAVDVDVNNIDFDKLLISKPKKTDDSLFGNISFEHNRLNIHFYNVEILKHKKIRHMTNHYTVIFLKVSKKVCEKMLEFDNHCIDQVQQNISSWFSKALDENVIEEYYTSSVTINRSTGFVVKLKLQGVDDVFECGKYDMIVSLKGLRFYKQRFIPEWEILSAKKMGEDFLNSIVDEDEDPWQEATFEEDVLPEPNEEEILQIVNGLKDRIHHEKNILVSEYKSLKTKISKYKELEEELNTFVDSKSTQYSVLDEISDKFDMFMTSG